MKSVNGRGGRRGDGPSGSTFIEVQVAVLLFGFAALGLGGRLQSIGRQVGELRQLQAGHLDVAVSFPPCGQPASLQVCPHQTKILEINNRTDSLETVVEASFKAQ